MQTLKVEKRDAIVAAARTALVSDINASVATIAKRAGVSTGLVYRYFPDKAALYDAAVPRSDVAAFKHLLLQRAKAAGTASYDTFIEELFRFCETHREQVILAVREELFDELVKELT